MALTTQAKVKAWLNITTTDKDALIDELILNVQALIETICDRKFDEDTYTEKYDGEGVPTLFLNQYPVSSITSIHDDPDQDFDADTLIDADDYTLSKKNGRVALKSGVFMDSYDNVQVVYTAGYASGEIPSDLDYACKKIVAEVMKQGRAMNQAPRDKSDVFILDIMNQDNEITAILQKYKRVNV